MFYSIACNTHMNREFRSQDTKQCSTETQNTMLGMRLVARNRNTTLESSFQVDLLVRATSIESTFRWNSLMRSISLVFVINLYIKVIA